MACISFVFMRVAWSLSSYILHTLLEWLWPPHCTVWTHAELTLKITCFYGLQWRDHFVVVFMLTQNFGKLTWTLTCTNFKKSNPIWGGPEDNQTWSKMQLTWTVPNSERTPAAINYAMARKDSNIIIIKQIATTKNKCNASETNSEVLFSPPSPIIKYF